jgi:hypothetical protein
MGANAYRGEVAVVLGDRSYIMRPTFSAIEQIEQETDKPLQELVGRGVACVLSVSDIATIIHAGIAHDDCPDRAAIGQIAIENGIQDLYPPVGKFLIYALTGGRDPERDDAGEDAPGEPMPERVIRSGGWRGWLAGLWAGRSRSSGDQPRTN